ncbi:MAG: MATE family efflux transporter [Myxococcales bacterium]|nr:MATE family efflux transporter [Myxococcales bacterium]
MSTGKDRVINRPMGTYAELIRVAWPIVVANLSYTAMALTDTVVVAQLGTKEVAAVGLAGTITWALVVFGVGLISAVKVVVSQAHGSGEDARTISGTYQGVAAALLVGLPLTALALSPVLGGFVHLMQVKGELYEIAEAYATTRSLGFIPTLVSFAAFGYFQGIGNTKVPMRITLFANGLNIVLDLVLVRGFGPIPAYGVNGVAIATVIALFVQCSAALWVLGRATWSKRVFTLRGTGELFRLGAPMGMRYCLEVLSWTVFTSFVSAQGEAHLAAHVITIRIVSVSFLPGNGISDATCVLTGQAIGARDEELAATIARKAMYCALAIMGAFGIMFFFGGGYLVGLFDSSDEVVMIGGPLMIIAAAFQIFDAVAMVKVGALNGAGDTLYVSVVSTVLAWAVLVPAGYFLCVRTEWGAPGAWLAVTVQIVVTAYLFINRWGSRRPVKRAVARVALKQEAMA